MSGIASLRMDRDVHLSFTTDQKWQLKIFESFSTLSFYSVNILDLKNKRSNTIINDKTHIFIAVYCNYDYD